VPIASCDFSTHEYSYDDTAGDMTMDNFALAPEDIQYKIPLLKQAKQLSNGQLRIFASPWSAPGWMKTNDEMRGSGLLDGPIDGPYYESYATYLVKFFEAYHDQGVEFWGMTSQNEPTTGRKKDFKWQTMFFNASMQRYGL
jgi:glucosylceramidase